MKFLSSAMQANENGDICYLLGKTFELMGDKKEYKN